MNKKMKVTVITGFLGSGKTTVLNKLVEKHKDKKVVIIENEFGEINIDRKLIMGIEGNNIYELSNGCLCCTLNNEFGVLLNSLILSNIKCDHLVIETTGIADPGDIIQTFLRGGRVYEYFELACVLCVVDAFNFKNEITESEEAAKQVALADVIMLNKIDLIEWEQLNGIENEIRHYNKEAEIIPVEKGETEKFNLEMKVFYAPENVEEKLKKSLKDTHHHTDVHSHNHLIESHSFVFEGVFPLRKFAVWLDAFLMFSKSVYRVKGILNIEDEPNRYILQAVNKAFSILEGSRWEADENRLNEIVFIGKEINREEIEISLKKLLLPM